MSHAIDYENRTFTCGESGVVFHLRKVSGMAMTKLLADVERRRPKVPMIEVELGGSGQTHLEQNPYDPDYVKATDEYEIDQGQVLLQYQFVMGISDDPPEDVKARLLNLWPSWSQADIKYMWISESLGDEGDDVTGLIVAIMSQSMVTAEGLAQSEAAFRNNGQREPDPELAT